jgi:hypothetical protein
VVRSDVDGEAADEDGVVVLRDPEPAGDLHAAVREAAGVCPAAAVTPTTPAERGRRQELSSSGSPQYSSGPRSETGACSSHQPR